MKGTHIALLVAFLAAGCSDEPAETPLIVDTADASDDSGQSQDQDASTDAANDVGSSPPCTIEWGAPENEPIPEFVYGENIPEVLWNDPAIVLGPDGWEMWFSGGVQPADPPVNGCYDLDAERDPRVSVYRATSTDGETWDVNLQPVLSPGERGEWDDARVETPSVVRAADGTYHLYYSGGGACDGLAVLSIGHATSTDGVNWTKDPNNPVITVAEPGTSDWGVFTVAEPGAVIDPVSGDIRVYYASAGGSAEHVGDFAILLATSSDGSTFEHHVDAEGNREPVWSLTESYAPAVEYRGLSTPDVSIGPGGQYHLVHDVVRYTDPQSRMGFDQASVGYATSADGIVFVEQAVEIVDKDQEGVWFSREVRAPTLALGEEPVMLFSGGEPIDSWDGHIEGMGRVRGTYRCE